MNPPKSAIKFYLELLKSLDCVNDFKTGGMRLPMKIYYKFSTIFSPLIKINPKPLIAVFEDTVDTSDIKHHLRARDTIYGFSSKEKKFIFSTANLRKKSEQKMLDRLNLQIEAHPVNKRSNINMIFTNDGFLRGLDGFLRPRILLNLKKAKDSSILNFGANLKLLEDGSICSLKPRGNKFIEQKSSFCYLLKRGNGKDYLTVFSKNTKRKLWSFKNPIKLPGDDFAGFANYQFIEIPPTENEFISKPGDIRGNTRYVLIKYDDSFIKGFCLSTKRVLFTLGENMEHPDPESDIPLDRLIKIMHLRGSLLLVVTSKKFIFYDILRKQVVRFIEPEKDSVSGGGFPRGFQHHHIFYFEDPEKAHNLADFDYEGKIDQKIDEKKKREGYLVIGNHFFQSLVLYIKLDYTYPKLITNVEIRSILPERCPENAQFEAWLSRSRSSIFCGATSQGLYIKIKKASTTESKPIEILNLIRVKMN